MNNIIKSGFQLQQDIIRKLEWKPVFNADKKDVTQDELGSIKKIAATGRITRSIAHEVRNPLTNISLAAELIKEMNCNPQANLLLEMISRNTNRINQLVSDLLNVMHFEELDFKLAAVNDLMDEALGRANDRIWLNNIKVEKEYTNEACLVMCDTEKIKLAFLNIIINGIEAMEKDKGLLQLKTSKAGNKCIIEIKDNGSGMDEATLQKLFVPYFTTKSSGNGLGMTNTQRIILNHKGSIKAYSKPNQGTSFLISLDIIK